jgi:hypothetical protein
LWKRVGDSARIGGERGEHVVGNRDFAVLAGEHAGQIRRIER